MTAGDDMERDFETNPYTKDERRVAEYIAGLGVGGGDDPIGFILSSHAALAAAGPGREKTIEECARRIDNSVFAASSRSRAIAFKDAAKIIRALASQPAKPVPVEAVEAAKLILAYLVDGSLAAGGRHQDNCIKVARALLAMAEKE
jgi:hypothetical protein